MTNALNAFRAADFNWVRQLPSVWRNPLYHVPAIHQEVVDDVIDYFTDKTRRADGDGEPVGRVIIGSAGFGKTHLVGELRRRVWEMGGWFILLDLVGVKDFWASVALGFLNSLQARTGENGETQYDRLISALAEHLGIKRQMADIVRHHHGAPHALVTGLVDLFVKALSKRYFRETAAHRDVVTALILLISEDLDCHSIAHAWLQGMTLDAELVKPFGIIGQNDPIKVVKGLSWVMSLVGPALIAVDQIDAILSASNAAARTADDEQAETQSIVEALSQGLMDLHELKRRAVTVISCLESTWSILEKRASAAVTDRYNKPVILRSLSSAAQAKALVAARLYQAYEPSGFKPDYPTWPFADSFFAQTAGYSPRQLLKACDAHQEHCRTAKAVTECTGLESISKDSTEAPGNGIDAAYTKALADADINKLTGADSEDGLRDLFHQMLELFPQQFTLPDDIDAAVQRDPDQKRPSIHGRLSFTFHNENDREQQYCFRILEKTNAIAFQSRLKAAMTASGIDSPLKFRHLTVLRSNPVPGGKKTEALAEQFQKAGGKFIAPTPEELRVFAALRTLAAAKPDGFTAWLRNKKPLFGCSVFQTAGLCPPPFLSGETAAVAEPPPKTKTPASSPAPAEKKPPRKTAKPVPVHTATPGVIPVGHRFSNGKAGEPVTLATRLLPSHTVILAGSGSGKTVLLRRLIEEAALQGIPAIVLDVNNDLSRLGDAWPDRPKGFDDSDVAASAAYHRQADVVIWTPGVGSGNPIALNLLPNFAAIGTGEDLQSQDERSQAIEMARATLTSFLPTGGKKGNLLQGVLADALRRFAETGGCTLDKLIALLAELPEDVSDIDNADKMACDMANHLRAMRSTNPLLQADATSLDPQQLFYGPDGKTRISVINLAGLVSDEAKQAFVNQLQMTLFTWIKQHPSPTGRLYVLDEAQNFVPSTGTTAASASASALTAQARKYGLGMIFATQHPKGIANGIIQNCTTSLYGRMNAPNTINAVRELMAAKGGAADNIGSLSPGEFYFVTAKYERPVQIRTPLCLSWHPQNPPTAEEIMRKAQACRKRMQAADQTSADAKRAAAG